MFSSGTELNLDFNDTYFTIKYMSISFLPCTLLFDFTYLMNILVPMLGLFSQDCGPLGSQ